MPGTVHSKVTWWKISCLSLNTMANFVFLIFFFFCKRPFIQALNVVFYHELLFPPVSSIQAGGRWHRDAGAVCSRGQILHRVPSPTERRSDHPGELPQPDHTGNHPPSGTDTGVFPAVGASFTCLTLFLSQNGNITELLLKEGFARCVDWSMAVYTQGAEKLRAAER